LSWNGTAGKPRKDLQQIFQPAREKSSTTIYWFKGIKL
jgi:hypothetical protein